jgi:hypothetical protein
VRQLKKKKFKMLDIRAETDDDNDFIDDPSQEGVLIMSTTPCLSLL